MKIEEGSAPLYTGSALLKKIERLGLRLPDDLASVAVVRGLRDYDVRNEMAELQQESRLQLPGGRAFKCGISRRNALTRSAKGNCIEPGK